jgi:pilus assembly protein Flp/PilA
MSKLQLFKRFRQDEEGAAMIEYVVICGLIVAVSAAILITIGGQVNTIFDKVSSVLGVAIAGMGGS